MPSGGRFVGIRAKLLAFYGLAILLVIAAELASQAASAAANRDYEARLARYHAVHRYRVAFDAHRVLLERLLREGMSEEDERLLDERTLGLVWLFEELSPIDSLPMPDFFEAQAAGRAMDAYLPLASRAMDRRRAGDPDYYADYAKAERIARYADAYLTKLLSMELERGETAFKAEARLAARSREAALAAIAGIGAFALFMSSLAATRLTLPLRRLAEAAARMAEGDLDVAPVRAAPGDEVAILAVAFNSMSASIRGMVDDLKRAAVLERKLLAEEAELAKAERALAEARFMALQDQIRPHFLFNALNSIARSALIEGAARTSDLAHGLGRLMRYALGASEPLVPLEEEFAITREYLAFQGARFGERLTWDARLEPDLASLKVPRFSIQPLAENAVRHGIEPLESGGRILVDARMKGERALVRVLDSGVGIGSERLKAIRKAVAAAAAAGGGSAAAVGGAADATDASTIGGALGAERAEGGDGAGRRGKPGEADPGLGLANVAGRLALMWRGGGRLSLSSSVGRGTVVAVSFQAEAIEADAEPFVEAGAGSGADPGVGTGVGSGSGALQ